MSDEIIKLLDDLGDRLGIAIDWSSKNITPYLKDLFERYIDYEITTSYVWIVIFAIWIVMSIIGICVVSDYANKKMAKNKESSWGEGKFCLNCIFILLIIISIIGLMCQIFDIVTCQTIPEKMLFEYLQSMTSTS